jgi:quinol monooxygenase YgiN
MYVVFTVVQIDPGRNSAAVQMLRDQLIPQVKQAPGFIKGTWFGDDNSGHGVVAFETREQAEQAKQPINSNVLDGVRVVSSDVYRVDAAA